MENSNVYNFDEFTTNSSEDEGFKELESNASLIVCQDVLNISSSSPRLLEQARLVLEDYFSELAFAPATEPMRTRRTHFTRKDLEKDYELFRQPSEAQSLKISYNRDELLSFRAKAEDQLPTEWQEISRNFPKIVKPVCSEDVSENPCTKPSTRESSSRFCASESPKITYNYENLMYLARNRISISQPKNWDQIEKCFPQIVHKNTVQYEKVEMFTRDPFTNQDYIEHFEIQS